MKSAYIAVLTIAVAFSGFTLAEDEVAEIKSAEALKALKDYQTAISELDESFQEAQRKREADYLQQVSATREELKVALTKAQDAATKDAALDNAILIRDTIRRIESGQTDESRARQARILELKSELSRLEAAEPEPIGNTRHLKHAVVGRWRWCSGVDVIVLKDGTGYAVLPQKKKMALRWRLLNSRHRTFEFQWPKTRDVLKLSKNKRLVEGPSLGDPSVTLWAARID